MEQQPMINRLIVLYERKYRKEHPGFEKYAEDQKFNRSLADQVQDLYQLSRNKFLELLVEDSVF